MNPLAHRSDWEIPISELRARTAKLRATEKQTAIGSSVKQPRKHVPLTTGRVTPRVVRLLHGADSKFANDNGFTCKNRRVV